MPSQRLPKGYQGGEEPQAPVATVHYPAKLRPLPTLIGLRQAAATALGPKMVVGAKSGGLWNPLPMALCIAQNPEADALLEREPLALLIGMLLDQQIQMEVAFNGPYKLYTRLGNSLDINKIAEYDPDEFTALAITPPAIHRYGSSMAKRVQVLCRFLVTEWDGDPVAIWTRDKPTGAEVLNRLNDLPGYGEQKAKIFLALLGKQLNVTPYAWRKAAGDYGAANSRRSVADVTNRQTLDEVRSFKKLVKVAKKTP